MTSPTAHVPAHLPVFANRYFLYVFTSNLVFYVPTLLVHFQRHGIRTDELFFLVATYTFVLASTDVPTGAIADTIGVRKTLLASLVVAILGALVLGMAASFWTFAVGQTMVALALSLRSGADAAYLFSLSGSGETYQGLEGRSTSIGYVALALASIAGALLATVDTSIPFYVTVATLGVGLMAFLALPAPARPTPRRLSARGVVAQSIKGIRTDAVLATLILAVAGLLTVAGIVFWSLQPYLEHLGFPVGIFGVAYAVYFFAAAVGARSARTINNRVGHWRALAIASVILCFAVLGMGLATGPLAAALPVITQFLTGYLFPTLRYIVQHRVDAGVRSTTLSIESVAQRLLFTGTSFAVGTAAATYGIANTLTGVGLVGLAVFPAMFFVLARMPARLLERSAPGLGAGRANGVSSPVAD